MAVSKKKKAAFASLIARQKEERKNEPVDGRKHSTGGVKGSGSALSAEAGTGGAGVAGGEGSDPATGRDSANRSAEQGDVGGPDGGAGSRQTHSDRTSQREDTGRSGKRVRKLGPRPRAELAPEARNFTIEPRAEPQPTGRVSRLRANLEAIKLLKELEAQQRLASPEEKAILARYNGFGADKEVFNSSMAQYRGFAHRNNFPFYAGTEVIDEETGETRRVGGWEQEYGKWYDAFRAVMTEEEWNTCSHSSLNSHYTPAAICHELWALALRAGFRGGRVFEPGCGVGNFMGTMPEAVREGSSVSGVELDSLSARIAAKIYPENQIELSGIEHAVMVGDNTQDLVMGNVPFSDTEPAGQKGSVKLNLHNLCISKGIDKLRPGGVAILITSHSTLDHNDGQRGVLAGKAELVAAVRLPNNAFQHNANTEVVCDILVLRKPIGNWLGPESWRQVEPIEVAKEEASANGNRLVGINEYFCRNPEMMLGTPSLQGKMYGSDARGQFTVKSDFGRGTLVLTAALREALGRVPDNILSPANEARALEEFVPRAVTSLDIGSFVEEELEQALGSARKGIYVIGARGGGSSEKVYLQPPWRSEQADLPRGTSADDLDEMAREFIGLRSRLEELIAHDLSLEATNRTSRARRQELRRQYDGFVLRYGPLNTNRILKRYFREDPAIGSLMALENTRVVSGGDGSKRVECDPAAILSERTIFPVVPPGKADSLG